MFILFPIGRKTELHLFPWITCALIALNILIFFLTWPKEKRFFNEQVSPEEYTYIAEQLIAIATHPESNLPEDIQYRLNEEKKSDNFPTPFIEETFQSIQDGTIPISSQTKYAWDLLYPRYIAFRSSLEQTSQKKHSIFHTYGFSSTKRIFPNIITYQFLHAGILHIFFNMFFLWLVGCNIEERWGPIIFLTLYLVGGAAAALAQSFFHPGTPLVGSSGAVAAIMGAFLIRHAAIKIRFFYFVFFFTAFRSGVFYMPAWVALPLWFFQQLFMGMMTLKYSPTVGYWAHAGGFLFGVTGGIIIKIFDMGRTWEEKAEQSPKACEKKLEKAHSDLRFKFYDSAEKTFKEVIRLFPTHTKARQGILKLYEEKKDHHNLCREAVSWMQAAFTKGDMMVINDLLNLIEPMIESSDLPDFVLFQIASFYEKAERWKEALSVYKRTIEQFPGSSYYPKSLFACGKILMQKLGEGLEAMKYFDPLLKPPYDREWTDAIKKLQKS